MITPYTSGSIKITPLINGADRYTKISYPLRYGRYSQIENEKYIFQFNLNGEITFARGKNGGWIDPQEWLKRSVGNDWVYYSTGGYTGVFEAIGEYYLPNLQYPSNSLIGGTPFKNEAVAHLIAEWYNTVEEIISQIRNPSREITSLFDRILHCTPSYLQQKSQHLSTISGGRVTVLPPDARHVDYDIIPLTVSNGCLYKCSFCKVKNRNPFKEKDVHSVKVQRERLRNLYGDNLCNYNSVFLGEHDALACSDNFLLMTIEQTVEELNLNSSYMKGSNFFLFGSVDSFLHKEMSFFEELKKISSQFYINLGLESADQQTLDLLGKPVTVDKVQESFRKMQVINDLFLNVEITGNFLMDETLPENHMLSFMELVRDSLPNKKPKGSIYLSPLKFGNPSRELVMDFSKVKLASRLPTFLYIIQRL